MAFLAADPLIAANINLERLSSACPGLDPFTVEVRTAPWIVRRALPKNIAAVALPWAIYVLPEYFAMPRRELAPLIAHELTHIHQWRTEGVLKMSARYVADYLRQRRRTGSHWEAYRCIQYEVDARSAAEFVCGGHQ